jgi:hypothetical protein
MESRRPWWIWPNLLSLDAPIVAVLWQRFLTAQFGVALPAAPSVVLGLVVWGVYLLDRGLDARASQPFEPAQRHLFAHQYRRAVTAVGALALVVGAIIAFATLPTVSLFGGAVVGVLLGIYLAVVHFTRHGLGGGKELAVGLVFAGGVGVPLVTRTGESVALWWPAVVGFAAVCFLNCLLIDHWEQNRGWTRWASLSVLVTLAAALVVPFTIGIALIAALGLMILLQLGRRQLSVPALRVLVDVALLTPLIVWPR